MPTAFASCAAESDPEGPFGFEAVWRAYRACRRGEPRPVTDGADFLGYIVRPHYRLVRRRVVGNLRARLDGFQRELRLPGDRGQGALLRRRTRGALRATLASYLAHFRHADAWRLARSLWADYPWLGLLLGLRTDWGLTPLWEPASVTSLHGQWRFFARRFPETPILMQVGNRLEACDGHARTLAAWGLPVRDPVRPGFAAGGALPMRALRPFTDRLRRHGVGHAFVAEEGYLKGGLKRRVLRAAWWPAPDPPLFPTRAE